MSLHSRFIQNVSANWVTLAINAFVGIYMVPLLIHHLGMTAYGVWVLLMQTVMIALVFSRGLQLSINRFVAFHRDRPDDYNRFINSALVLAGAFSLVIVVGTIGLAAGLTSLFETIPDELAPQAHLTCLLAGLTIVAMMFEASFNEILNGFFHHARANVVLSLTALIRLTAMIVVLRSVSNIVVVQAVYLGSFTLSALGMAIVLKITVRAVRLGPRYIDGPAMRELFHYAAHSFTSQGLPIFLDSAMIILLGRFGEARHVAIFEIARKIPFFMRRFIISVLAVFMPLISTFHARREMARLKNLIVRGTRLGAALMLGLSLWVVTLAPTILDLWLGQNVAPGTVQVLRLMVLATVPIGLFELWVMLLIGMGYLRGVTVASLTAVALTLGLEILLLHQPWPTNPAMAPAIALGVALWLKNVGWLPLYGLRRIDGLALGVGKYFRAGLGRPLLAVVVAAAPVLIVVRVGSNAAWPPLVLILTTAGLIAMVFVPLALGEEARLVWAGVARRISRAG